MVVVPGLCGCTIAKPQQTLIVYVIFFSSYFAFDVVDVRVSPFG
jgi:hypothetical protein